MLRRSYILFYTLFILLTAAAGCRTTKKSAAAKAASPPFISGETASTAFRAFNQYFYNPDAGLYYSTTGHTGLAAIWTQAIYLEMVMDAYKRTRDKAYLKMINEICQGGSRQYAGYDWYNKKTWFIYDDMMWWINALARAYRLTGRQQYLDASVAGFKRVWNSAHDSRRGGMYWQFKHQAKNACINYPTVIASMRLFRITKDSSYFSKAERLYAWSRAHLFDTTTGRVVDHLGNNGRKGWEDYTYNQGTCIGAAVILYRATGSPGYLADARLAADYTKSKMCDAAGILPAEGDWNEQGVLKAIFAHYMMMLVNECGQKQYLPWIQKNINTAWANRDRNRNLMYRNYAVPCPSGDIQSYEASSAVAFMQVCAEER